ncbi:MAG: uracil-DNA glycosylase family protein [Planctomycetia bacterium]|nr:uracil-DNA glycosylase family protein [Planctomycetia bacterium]
METHPWLPFYPPDARMLMLGSFPPPPSRWSMPFYYPNWQNDMWRIVAAVFFNDRHYFEIPGRKAFDQEKLVSFLTERGIALSDVASTARRAKGNASDAFLEIIQTIDPRKELARLPQCHALVTTGKLASTMLQLALKKSFKRDFELPAMETFVELTLFDRTLRWYRMPSSSRAYPLPFDRKVTAYYNLFKDCNLL